MYGLTGLDLGRGGEALGAARQDGVDRRRDRVPGARLTLLGQDRERGVLAVGVDGRLQRLEDRPVLEVTEVVGVRLGVRGERPATDLDGR